ncbi:MAG: PPOX class F420-dependent oxidoreductase [Anaerolineaceae bacterium]|nr:PPOX class F420-dependent oxidoreductase [Anaerolineaceae bacterium]
MFGTEQFKAQNYLNLKTFRKNGEGVPTPVWFVRDGEKFYIRTVAGSGKVKRIRNNANVQIMPCGQQGEPLGKWIAAQAHEITDAETYAAVKVLLVAKYGAMVETLEAQSQDQGYQYTVLLVEPEES